MVNLLLIIDMQEGFRYLESEEILSNILKLNNSFDGKLIFTKFINDKNSLFEKQLNWRKFQKKRDQELFQELQKLNNLELNHNSYTILNNNLIKFIQENKISKVYLSGIFTDVCIIKTAMDLFDFGIETFIIKDACNSLHGKNNHNFAINSLKHILGEKQIISTNEIIS